MTALEAALAEIDEIHAKDPNRVEVDGESIPAELLYARRMTAWLERLDPAPSVELQLAVRAQHLARWELPRDTFPDGRTGYKRWRSEQARRHAALTRKLLEQQGFSAGQIQRVAALIQKQRLRQDAEAQTLEDAACLVFLQYELAAFAAKHADDKVVGILQKSWSKMSLPAREQGLKMVHEGRIRVLLERALAGAMSG